MGTMAVLYGFILIQGADYMGIVLHLDLYLDSWAMAVLYETMGMVLHLDLWLCFLMHGVGLSWLLRWRCLLS